VRVVGFGFHGFADVCAILPALFNFFLVQFGQIESNPLKFSPIFGAAEMRIRFFFHQASAHFQRTFSA
jgi:hypothetical protein